MNAKDIKKRRDIALAYAKGGRMTTYEALVKEFRTSNRVVADALSRPVGYWNGLLGAPEEPIVPGEQWEHALVAVKEQSPGILKVREDGRADWIDVEDDTITGICDTRGRDGWRLVSMQRVASGNLTSFSGVYELAFTRHVRNHTDD